MDKNLFKEQIKKAGFKTIKDFSKAINLSYVGVAQWGSLNPYPAYLNQMLEWAIKAKKYDEALKNGGENCQGDESGGELEKLRLENMALRERLREFEKFREALRAIM